MLGVVVLLAGGPILRADITGVGITVNIEGNTAGVNTVEFTGNSNVYVIGNSSAITPGNYTAPAALVGPIGSAAGNEASVGTFFVTPVYQRSDYKWDTEQLWVSSPKTERVVIEGRAGNRAFNGDQEAQIYQWNYTESTQPYEEFVGNPTPSAGNGTRTGFNATTGTPFSYDFTADAVAASQFGFSSGQLIPFSITYNRSNRLVTYAYGNGSITYTVPADDPFDSVLLRVNVADFASAGNRSLTLSDLRFAQLDAGGNVTSSENLISAVTGNNSLTSLASSTGAGDPSGQRQFTLWEDPAISDLLSFRITGNATFAWTTSSAPGQSQVAFQFKFIEGTAPIPEPGTVGMVALGAGIGLLRRRRQRRGGG